MKIVLKNNGDVPVQVIFENDTKDWNTNPKSEVEIEIEDGAEIKFSAGKIETTGVKRPKGTKKN